MDAERKTKLEQRIVIGLLGVFAVTLGTSLKNAGVFGRAAPPATVVTSVASEHAPPAPSLAETVASYREQTQPRVEIASPARVPLPEVALQPINYTAGDARDPFESQLPREPLPAAAMMGATGEAMMGTGDGPPDVTQTLVVQGILWGGARPTAIINDQVYGLGDAVDGATITRIDRNGVTVDVDGASVHLRLSDVMSASLAPNPAWR